MGIAKTKLIIAVGVCCALVMGTFSSCKVKPPSQDVIIIDDTSVDTVEDVIEDVIIDTVRLPEPIEVDTMAQFFRNSYRVGMVLPLMEDSVKSAWSNFNEVNYNDFNFPKTAEKSLSFLEGFMMGAEQDATGPIFEFILYDNQENDFETDKALSSLLADSIDILIGGTNKNNLRKMADFALVNDIPFLSPFSPSKSVAVNNPNYLMMEPSIDEHLNAMANFIVDSLPNMHIKVIYEDNNMGMGFAAHLTALIQSRNDSIKNVAKRINFTSIPVSADSKERKDFNVGEYLDIGVENAVMVLSFNDGFVHSLLTQLNGKTNAYEITVFGMPTWENSETVRLQYFNSLRVHLSRSSVILNDREANSFGKRYKSIYYKKATEFAYLGFDTYNLLSESVKAKGVGFTDYLVRNTIKGTVKSYTFRPVFNSDKKVVRIANIDLHIVKYDGFETEVLK